MHDKGEKSCPICTEKMDLTDQQLKPCKCGYEICVWCWHHIMEMSEKDGSGGRCPACRAPYDKERIVSMAANCQRLVAEMNAQRKKKMHKLKPKSIEGKKHFTDIRVIQRNMVYIMGLPLSVADEALLQQKEYFGRYGKVLKVSLSRTSTGLIQHSASNICCVYVTYSKEAEAIRCIQSVHCFVLDGRSLRACFGTTKYCHAWLRNLPCRNRDCLYLHDYGSQEDSFTKDDLGLALARSRVHQIIGATSNLNWRSGNVLPPSEDDSRHMSSATKLVSQSASDKTESQTIGSCSAGPVSATAAPTVTSWAMRVSGSVPPDTASSCSGNSANRKVEASNDPQVSVSVVKSSNKTVLNTRSKEDKNSSEEHSGGVLLPSEVNKHNVGGSSQTLKSDVKEVIVEKLPTTVLSNSENSPAAFMGNDEDMVGPAASTNFVKLSKPHYGFNIDKAVGLSSNGNVQHLSSKLSSISMHCHLEDSCSIPDSDRLHSTHNSIDSSIGQHLQQGDQYSNEHSTTPDLWEDIIVDDMLNLDNEQSQFSKGVNNLSAGLCSPGLALNVDLSSPHPWKQVQLSHHHQLGKPSETVNQHSKTGSGKHVEIKDNVNNDASDMGENILSKELDAWEDSLVKLLDESEEPCRPINHLDKTQPLLKLQDKDQSRFSFARQDDFMNVASDLKQPFGITAHVSRGDFASNGFMGIKDTLPGKYAHLVPSNNSALSDRFVELPKAHASSPPGFSIPNRIAPPGFSHDSSMPVQHLPQYVLPSGNIGRIGGNVQPNNDAAILEAFRKGMLAERLSNASFDLRQSVVPQFSPVEHDARLMLLLQQSIPPQNLRLPDVAENRFPPQNGAYNARFLDQFQPNNPSILEQLHSQQFNANTLPSNSQWGAWHDAKNFSGLPMTQVLDNQRVGFNGFMPSYENIKF